MGKIDLDRLIGTLLHMHPNPLVNKITTNDIEAALYEQGLMHDDSRGIVEKVIEIQPLFHEGDWVVHRYTRRVSHICSVSDEMYMCDYGAQCFSRGHEGDYKIWELSDVRNGDILALSIPELKIAFISYGNDSYMGDPCMAHAGVAVHGHERRVFLDEPCGLAYKDRIRPATVDEIQQFMSDLRNRGLRWNSTDKEIEREDLVLTEFEERLKKIMMTCRETKCNVTTDIEVKDYAEQLLELVDK